MDDKQFHQLLEYLGLSWQGYRKVRRGVKKRVARLMQDQGCRNMGEFLQLLEKRKGARRQCERVMSVSISRFFRDQRLWEVLECQLLPELVETQRGRIRVWSAGCACGEEVYSLKILWERMGCVNLPVPDIRATDLNPLYLKRAQDALYPLNSLRMVPENIRKTCFQADPGGKRFKVKPALRTDIIWLEHNFFSTPPGSGFDLIFIRNNLLTYYRDELIEPALDKIIKALSKGGYMIIGAREKLPFQPLVLQPCPSLSYAFKKRA